MRNPLQEQLLKAGLVKKHQVAEAAREQARKRHGKTPAATGPDQVDARRLQAERAERDRQLSAERNAQLRARERQAQIRQIIETQQVAHEGEIAYRFVDGGAIRNVLVNEGLRTQLARGTLVIVRHDDGYALLPRTAADMIVERGGELVVDHARSTSDASDSDDEYYSRFKVPDDLVW